jgi:hypothetical protein
LRWPHPSDPESEKSKPARPGAGGGFSFKALQDSLDAMSALLLRRASLYRKGGSWSDDDFDVVEDARVIGRIYRVVGKSERWFWGIDYFLAGRRAIYDHAASREAAMVALKAAWKQRARS